MAGLKLKLRPEEQILINGAIIQNGRHQVELTVKTPNTRILRLRDAIHPDEAVTPVKRVCFVAQMSVAGEVDDEQAYSEFTAGVKALQTVFLDVGSQEVMKKALIQAEERNFYKAMQFMRKMIPYEEALILKYDAVKNMTQEAIAASDENIVTLKELHDRLMIEQDKSPSIGSDKRKEA